MKISVIIPAYNCEKTIERCIDSLLCQHGAELEIIAVNDGSSDRTLSKLNAYGEKIKVISIPNSGVAGARNAGLAHAEGEFLLFLDSDDFFRENAIRRLVEAQQMHDADIVHFRYEYVYPDGRTFVPERQIGEDFFAEKRDFPDRVYPMFWKGIYLNSVCMSMFRKSTVQEIRFCTDLKTAEDAFFSLAAFTNAKSAEFLSDILYEYTQSGEGITGSGISVFQKYRDNFAFARETASKLRGWGMNTLKNYAAVYFRPVRVTLDKVGRMLQKTKDVQS